MVIKIFSKLKIVVAIAGLGLSAMLLTGPTAFAEPVDYGACVSTNKKIKGATAACAAEICAWEVCKSQIIYSTGTTGVSTEAPLSYNRDPGAEGAAITTCMPKQQIMNSCLNAAARKRSNTFCKTGSDDDLPFIRAQLNAKTSSFKSLKKEIDELTTNINDQKEEHQAIIDVWQPMNNEYHSDLSMARSAPSAAEYVQGKWISSGKRGHMNNLAASASTLAASINADIETLKSMKTRSAKKSAELKFIAKNLLDDNQDCAAAKSELGG